MNKSVFFIKIIYLLLFLSLHYTTFANDTLAKSIRFESAVVLSRQDSLNSIESLKKEIDKLLSSKTFKNCDFGIAVYSLNQNKYIYSKNPDKLLTPASTMKLITTYSAFVGLGSDYIVSTKLYTDAATLNDSLLKGNVYLVGSGDALFSSEDLDSLVKTIKKLGIKKIIGNIYSDGSYFDSITDRFIYSGDKDRVENLQPITALSLDRNLLTVIVSGSRNDKLATVTVLPNTTAIVIKNSSTINSTSRKKSENLYFPDENNFLNYQYQTGGDIMLFAASKKHSKKKSLNINYSLTDDYQCLSIHGNINPSQSYSYQMHQKNPQLIAAGALQSKLLENGILANGNIDVKSVYNSDTFNSLKILCQSNRDLIELITQTNKHSDNYIAETIFKMIGAYYGNHKNNTEKSRYVITKLLNDIGIDASDFRINDGSGLSRRNKITTESLLKILIALSKRSDYVKFDSTLSFCGVDGTLRKRMIGTRAENNLHAKTGTLRNVSALAGYVTTLDDERLVFAFIFNGQNPSAYKAIEDEIGMLLSQFFYYHFEK